LDSLKQWLEETLGKLSRKSDTALAVRYALGRWEALLRYQQRPASQIADRTPLVWRTSSDLALSYPSMASPALCSFESGLAAGVGQLSVCQPRPLAKAFYASNSM